jgi:superfamily I DNA/RNA helicase
VRAGLAERRAVTWPDLFGRVTADVAGNESPFDFVVVDSALSDVDGNVEDRRGTVSVFNGPPTIETFDDPEQKSEAVAAWVKTASNREFSRTRLGSSMRSPRELRRARNAIKQAGVQSVELSDKIEITPGKVLVGTMHLAKELEFRSVAVVASDDEIIPSQGRIENVADDADLEVVYDTERHLLYVACTRARDHLLVTGVEPASVFLDDLTA